MQRIFFTFFLLVGSAASLYAEAQPMHNLQIPAHFLDVSRFVPEAVIDLRYATPFNFMGRALYPSARCYLHRTAVIALYHVQEELLTQNLRLKIYDAYRPLHVQQEMWDLIQDDRYVANPAVNQGRHTRGTAVDLTLVDIHGNELEMPCSFDTFDERAHSDNMNCSEEAIKNRSILKSVMERHGFLQLPTEWWHFDLSGWQDDKNYPASDLSFEAIDRMSHAGVLPTPPQK